MCPSCFLKVKVCLTCSLFFPSFHIVELSDSDTVPGTLELVYIRLYMRDVFCLLQLTVLTGTNGSMLLHQVPTPQLTGSLTNLKIASPQLILSVQG